MKQLAAALFFGRDTRLSGVIAFSIVALIALGCTCNKYFDTNSGSTDNSSRASNTSTDSNSSKPAATKADASTGNVPTDAQLQEIAKTTVLDFNSAIQSADFSSFHKTISKPFQKQVSVDRFKQVFQQFIDAKIDLSGVRSLDADFTTPPVVASSLGVKRLELKGSYPTSPRHTRFDLKYIPEGKDWKLIAIEINTKNEGEE